MVQSFLAEAVAVAVRRPYDPMSLLQTALGPTHLQVCTRSKLFGARIGEQSRQPLLLDEQ